MLIDCVENDQVYVYTKELFDLNGRIDENMLGIVDSIKQEAHPDWLGLDYSTYSLTIRLRSGRIITIQDEYTQPSRKYEFITIKDLKKYHSIEIAN